MKTIKIIITVCLILISFIGNAQKIKIKKGKALVDGKEYLDMSECKRFSNTCIINTLKGDDFMVVNYYSFEKPNPAKRNPRSKSPYKATITEGYSEITFLNPDLSCEVQLSRKKLIQKLYNSKVLDENGELDLSKVKIFIKKYSKKISQNKPSTTVIINR